MALYYFKEDYLNISNSSDFEKYPGSMFNFSMSNAIELLLEISQGSFLGTVGQAVFITIYSLLIGVGLIGNFLVAFVIGCKSQLRTANNLYIINLTISDVSMCLVCMPFTLVALLNKNWNLGSVICKLIPALQCTNILVSTATIVAIATDRYITIVLGNRGTGPRINVLSSLILIWVGSLGFTFPLLIFYYVERVTLNEIFLYNRCVENWQPPVVKTVWILCLLLIQYVIPILVLAFVHIRIKNFLTRNQSTRMGPRRLQREMERNKRTTALLISVALTFAISWLPWHVVNLLADVHYSGFKDSGYFYSVFGGCHAVAMTTTCSNPILYGWLNTNLKTELSTLLAWTGNKICCRWCGEERHHVQIGLNSQSEFSRTNQNKAEHSMGINQHFSLTSDPSACTSLGDTVLYNSPQSPLSRAEIRTKEEEEPIEESTDCPLMYRDKMTEELNSHALGQEDVALSCSYSSLRGSNSQDDEVSKGKKSNQNALSKVEINCNSNRSNSAKPANIFTIESRF